MRVQPNEVFFFFTRYPRKYSANKIIPKINKFFLSFSSFFVCGNNIFDGYPLAYTKETNVYCMSAESQFKVA